MVILGASGDLTQRKIVPGVYHPFWDHWLPERFAQIGSARTSYIESPFSEDRCKGVDPFSRGGKTKDEDWQAFAPHIHFMSPDYSDLGAYTPLPDSLSTIKLL